MGVCGGIEVLTRVMCQSALSVAFRNAPVRETRRLWPKSTTSRGFQGRRPHPLVPISDGHRYLSRRVDNDYRKPDLHSINIESGGLMENVLEGEADLSRRRYPRAAGPFPGSHLGERE